MSPDDGKQDIQQLRIREADHRIKNTLQIIASLLTIQMGRLDSKRARDALNTAAQRIRVAASLHDLLTSVSGRVVALDTYLRQVIGSFDLTARGIDVECAADHVEVDPSRALLLALFVSEAITNSVKHAFSDGRPGRISVELHVCRASLRLRVSDDGVGCDEEHSPESSGSKILQAIVSQLGARVSISTKPGAGYAIDLRVPKNHILPDDNPEDLRQQVRKLIEAVSRTGDRHEKKALASRAFALAQKAEAIERKK
jgi:two-component sensor histidine kinase